MTDAQLNKVERAIEALADTLGYSKKDVVKIILRGMEVTSPFGVLDKEEKKFINEMEDTFGI